MSEAPGAPPTEPRIRAVRGTENGCEIDLEAPADLAYFRGHFDGFPILPGVVQVDWVLRLAARHLGVTGRAARMQLKFQHPIRPGAQLTLSLSLSEANGRRQLSFAYRNGTLPCASGRIGLEPV